MSGLAKAENDALSTLRKTMLDIYGERDALAQQVQDLERKLAARDAVIEGNRKQLANAMQMDPTVLWERAWAGIGGMAAMAYVIGSGAPFEWRDKHRKAWDALMEIRKTLQEVREETRPPRPNGGSR